ncbi:lipid-A-disaccharide synthase [Fibrobacter sp.]|uniref:lipid-A-disaccharide synthase n=1 Tax=Fibrobacter sp. TaxID=35828 RepID=UPI00388E0C31
MTSDKPILLFCAGEDSGDSIGESLVRFAKNKLGSGVRLLGAGGRRMVAEGLSPVVEFDDLPVSGFGDILPRYFRLKKSFNTLRRILKNPECKGLVAIDYPGFNMKLVALAHQLKKPVFYVAPPQVWAWKQKRSKKLAFKEIHLACFFDFEEQAYRNAGCNVVRIQHPLVQNFHSYIEPKKNRTCDEEILLFPGSREGQALRNLSFFLKVINSLRDELLFSSSLASFPKVVVMASRESLKFSLEKNLKILLGEKPSYPVHVESVPLDFPTRKNRFEKALCALSIPGTVSIELALSGCNTVVCTVPDKLTYFIGKRLVKTECFALPSLILNRKIFPEHIVASPSADAIGKVSKDLQRIMSSSLDCEISKSLEGRLLEGMTVEQSMSEFLAKFF